MTTDKWEAAYPAFIKKENKPQLILSLKKQVRWSENLSGVDNLHTLLLFIWTLRSRIFYLMTVFLIHLIASVILNHVVYIRKFIK